MAKIINRFVTIIPARETYFMAVDNPATKISREVIFLNYGLLSPYKNGDLIFYSDKQKLYIWFTKEKLPSKKIYLPEAFLFFKAFKSKKDVILIREKEQQTVFVVIKNHILVSQITKGKETDLNQSVELLKKQYSLFSPAIITVSDPLTLSHLSLKDIIKFAYIFNLEPQTLLKNALEYCKVPFIVLLLVLNIADFSSYLYLNHVLHQEKSVLAKIERRNVAIKKQFKHLEEQKAFWDSFEQNELRYPNISTTLTVITDALLKHQGHINLFRQKENMINLWVVSTSSSALVQDLMKTGYFANIKVLNTAQDREDKGKEMARLELRIRERI